jgi:hypothetical protein
LVEDSYCRAFRHARDLLEKHNGVDISIRIIGATKGDPNTYGPLALLISLSILPPIDVNANRLLYCLVFARKCFDIGSFLLFISLDRNSGGSLKGGILICPCLQQFE